MPSTDDTNRGQSETLGVILAFAVVILGALVVVTLGAVAIDDTEQQLTQDRAEKALTELDSKAALVALGEADSRRISVGFDTAEQFSVQNESGWMNVTATDRSTGATTKVMNVTLGAVTYQSGDTSLAYQGGGVWRVNEQGGQMISPPEFHYREATLTLPTITVSGDATLGRNAVIRRQQTTRKFPRPSGTNPLEDHVVTVTVGSEYYRGWGEYFEERTDGNVDYDHERQRAELTLVSPIGKVRVESAVAGEASGGTLNFQANPAHPCHKGGNPKPTYFDSYNSSEPGSYCDNYEETEVNSAGDITFGGDITTQAAAGQIQGNLVSGGHVELFHNQDLHGNISHTDGCDLKGGPPHKGCESVQQGDQYSVQSITGVEATPSIGYVIETTVNSFRARGTETNLTDGDVLETGTYYTETVDLDGETVQFDTSDGNIALAVNDTIHLDSSLIRVVGGGEVNIYVNGSNGTDDLRLSNSNIFAPENNATKLTVLGNRNFDATVAGSEMTGVIYAPTGENGDGEVTIVDRSTVWGGIVTGDMTIGNPGGGTVHFDRALKDKQIVPPQRAIVRLTYLHVTENEITIESG